MDVALVVGGAPQEDLHLFAERVSQLRFLLDSPGLVDLLGQLLNLAFLLGKEVDGTVDVGC